MMRTMLPALCLLALSFLLPAAAVATVAEHPELAAMLYMFGLVLAVLAEGLVGRSRPLRITLERLNLGIALRAGLRDLALILLVAVNDSSDTARVAAVTVTVVLVSAARVGVLATGYVTARLNRSLVSWRNLEVPGVLRAPPVTPGRSTMLAGQVAWSSTLIGLGMAAVLLGAPAGLLWTAVPLTMLIAVGLLGISALDLARSRQNTPRAQTLELLQAALDEYAPEVVFYYSRPEAAGYIANVWMRTLEQLPQRVLVVVREAHNQWRVETDLLPVVRISASSDLERLLPASVRVALYPSNVAKNNHLIRLPGIVDVFVGHGDSDKGGSATVLTRIFDEVWVSGPAARDRYRVADVGVLPEQIREVGRPQLAEIAQGASAASAGADETDRAYTVLYAPTREGFYSEWEYSSVVTQGAGILRSLLALPDVRVLFKPHPGTGTDNPAYRVGVSALNDMVNAAGSPHEVVTGTGLYEAFNRADLLVSDVSSVITDFLAAGRPYVVTNSGSAPPESFRREFPSAAGGYILSGDGSDVARFVADARTVDSLHAERERTARYLLGDVDQDPNERFAAAVAAAASGTSATTT